MRRELLRQFFPMVSVILFFKPVECIFKADGCLWVSPSGAEQEIAVSVNYNARVLMVFKHAPESLVHRFAHWDFPCAALCFRLIHIVAFPGVFEELVANGNPAALKVNVARGQPAELGNPQPRAQEDNELIIMLFVYGIPLDEFQQALFQFRRKWHFRLPVILNHRAEFEIERVLPD